MGNLPVRRSAASSVMLGTRLTSTALLQAVLAKVLVGSIRTMDEQPATLLTVKLMLPPCGEMANGNATPRGWWWPSGIPPTSCRWPAKIR